MRRARSLFPLLGVALALATGSDAAPARVDRVNGIGIIDYASKPKLHLGDWVSYHMTGSSQMGESDDYDVTVVISGEERFWGEDCFWVETWTEDHKRPPRAIATLMSYAIFEDSLPTLRSQYYMRKTIDGLTPEGEPSEQLVRRPPSTLKRRGTLEALPSVRLDTLGVESLTAMGRSFDCRKVLWQEGKSATVDQRDSSITTEVRENRTLYLSKEVPVTGLVQEGIEHTIRRRSWAIGRSQEAASWTIMDRAVGAATLTGFGTGKESRLLPERKRVSLQQIDAAEKKSAPPAKPAAARRKG